VRCRPAAAFKGGPEGPGLSGGGCSEGSRGPGQPPREHGAQVRVHRPGQRISAGITATAGKLQRLSQLAKRTSMFDDPAVQINELTGLIKADIQGLNGALTDLSTFQGRQAGSGNRQVASLSTNTVDDLRARLKDTTASFRDVLTLRQENLRVHAAGGSSSPPRRRAGPSPRPRGQVPPARGLPEPGAVSSLPPGRSLPV